MNLPSIVLGATLLLWVISAAYAEHDPTTCIISVYGERHPVTYLNETRQNPDGTFYPGDAFYYLFRWQDRSPDEECTLLTPRLDSSGLLLNHTIVSRGTADTPLPAGAVQLDHRSHDPAVVLANSTHYHYSKTLEKCQAVYQKPGESRRSGWEKYAVYDEPFLILTEDRRLTEFEKTMAERAGKAVWDGWRPFKIHGDSYRDLPRCPFDVSPRDSANGPPAEWYGDRIFYVKRQTWALVQNSTTHAHISESYADPDSRAAFDERVGALCGALRPESGCVYGTAEINVHREQICLYDELGARGIDPSVPSAADGRTVYDVPADGCTGGHSIEPALALTVRGAYLTAHHHDNSNVPVSGYKETAKDLRPPMQDAELHIILTKPPLHHREGYNAQNLDGTYYHDDPIHIHHEPSWKWKDERAAHIHFTIDRLHRHLPLKDDHHSMFVLTNHTVSVGNWLNETLWYGNGDGMSVYVAGAHHRFGSYAFDFEMRAWNLDTMAANASAGTTGVVVPYIPHYEEAYSYPVLGDGQEYAFDDRRGVAMRYGGGWEDGVLHPMRRSLINGWEAVGTGHDPFTHVRFDLPHRLDEGRNSSHGHTALMHAPGTGTAMFVRAGHGAILFEWPVSHLVFAGGQGAVYENVTSRLTVYSLEFAGMGGSSLYRTEMRYPEMPFTKNVHIKSVDQAGQIQHGDLIRLRVEPYMGAEYLADYIRDKIRYDTGDEIVAQTVLHDAHPMVQEWSGRGEINATILRTSVHFGDIAVQRPPEDHPEGPAPAGGRYVEPIDLAALAESPETLRLDAPYDLGLSVLAPTLLVITTSDGVEHHVGHKYYSFGGRETITMNTKKDNAATIERKDGMMVIGQPENFGIIKRVEINGAELMHPCPVGCAVPLLSAAPVHVTLYNEWGGQAHGMSDAAPASVQASPEWPRPWVAGAVAVLLLLPAYLVMRRLR